VHVDVPLKINFIHSVFTQGATAQCGNKSNDKNSKNIQFFYMAANAPAILKAAVPAMIITLRSSTR